MPHGEAHEGSWASRPSITQRKSTNENSFIINPISTTMPDGNIIIYFTFFNKNLDKTNKFPLTNRN